MPFFTSQQKIVLENSGIIDPEQIKEYIAADGYRALVTALTEMTPAEVLREVDASGLRGRGGGGYPAGLKWSTVSKMPGDEKFVVCNGDEGDPGAFMDRAVLESDPHRVIEGMVLAALCRRRDARVHLRAGRVSVGDRTADDRHPGCDAAGISGTEHLRDAFQF